MNSIIYKYQLEVNECVIELPVHFKVVCVHEQNGVPTLWIEQNQNANKISIRWHVVGTGQEIPSYSTHEGTCFIGSYVWHIYRTHVTVELD